MVISSETEIAHYSINWILTELPDNLVLQEPQDDQLFKINLKILNIKLNTNYHVASITHNLKRQNSVKHEQYDSHHKFVEKYLNETIPIKSILFTFYIYLHGDGK